MCTKKITSGAAQGSILGPELWNITYNEILDMNSDTYIVGYADDKAAGRDIEEIQRKFNQVMIGTKVWLNDHYLKLATEKTELVIIRRRHMPLTVEMQVLTENPHTAVH